MKVFWRSLSALSLILCCNPPAYAKYFETNLAMAISASAPSERFSGSNLRWTGNASTGMGIFLATNLGNSPFDMESGVIYQNENLERVQGSDTLTRKTHQLQIPLLIRYHFDEKMAIGLGGYTTIAQGSVLQEVNQIGTLSSYIDSGIKTRDFGLLLSARASLKIMEHWYLIIDGRYQHGLSNLASIPPRASQDFLNTRTFQAYLGISYRFGL